MRDKIAVCPVIGEGPPFNVPPAAFGRFRVLHQIGAGSLGPVFRAEDPASQTSVVIKVLRLNLTPERARIVTDELLALRDRIPAHPGIAPIVKAGIRDVEPFVVCAFMPGDSLDVTLRELGPSSLSEAMPRLIQIAAGLDFCADASIWHGALHPRDVLVSATETAVVGVGIAPILERVGVKLPVRRPYTAPEVVDGLATSPAADQFALAAIVFEWLYGRRIVGPAQGRIEVPEMMGIDRSAMADAFSLALSADPDVRFESSSAFVAALADAMEQKLESPSPAPSRVSSHRPPPAALTAVVPALLVEARDTTSSREALAQPSVASGVESVTTARIDQLRLPEALSESRSNEPHAPVRRLPEQRSLVSLLNVLTALAAAVIIGTGLGYWFAIQPAADSTAVRPLPQASSAPTTAAPALAATAATPGVTVGSLLIESRPVGANVFIDGRATGTTPMTFEGLAPGAHAVRLERSGYHPWTTTVSVVPGEMTRLAALLAGEREHQ